MSIPDAADLIKSAFTGSTNPTTWADLGCGQGIFTLALAHHLTDDSTLYAVDKNFQKIPPPAKRKINIRFLQADFEKSELVLPKLDGILMANSLHYVADKKNLLLKLQRYLSPGGRFIIVEYDSLVSNPWVPYPVDFQTLCRLLEQAGYKEVIKLAERRSLYRAGNMYAALCW